MEGVRDCIIKKTISMCSLQINGEFAKKNDPVFLMHKNMRMQSSDLVLSRATKVFSCRRLPRHKSNKFHACGSFFAMKFNATVIFSAWEVTYIAVELQVFIAI